MTRAVFFAPPAAVQALGVAHVWTLDGPEGRHAATVRRVRPGELLDVVDGAGTRLECEVQAVAGQSVKLCVRARLYEPPPAQRVVLVQALAKGGRDELAIETATEVGVDLIVPWQAQRSVSVWRGDRAAKAHARWQTSVREAAKQARRAHVPPVAPLVDTAALARQVAIAVAAGATCLVLDSTGEPLSQLDLPGEVWLVVGPEGGIEPRELDQLCASGARCARLGPHILRTSSAGPIAAALVCTASGRWDSAGGTGGPGRGE